MLLAREEFVDNCEKLCGAFLAGIVASVGNCHDLRLRQCLTEFLLSCGGNDGAASAQDVDDRGLDLAHKASEFRRYKAVADRRIALPDDSAVGSRLRSVMDVCAKNVFARAGISVFLP